MPGAPQDLVHENLEDALDNDGVWSPPNANKDHLVVFLHGFGVQSKDYKPLLIKMQGASGARLYAPAFDAAFYSDADPNDIVRKLADRMVDVAAKYPRLHLHVTAHSMGTLFAREALLAALRRSDILLENFREGRVRMTLMAGTNRGFKPDNVRHLIGYHLIRRWFWITLLVIALAWWLRLFASQPGVFFQSTLAAVAVKVIASIGVAAFPVVLLLIHKSLPKRSFGTFLAASVWMVWATWWLGLFASQPGGLFQSTIAAAAAKVVASIGVAAFPVIFWTNRESLPKRSEVIFLAAGAWMLWAALGHVWAFWTALGFHVVGTFLIGWLLARERSAAFVMTIVTFGVGCSAPWIADRWWLAWPATLALLLPYALYPMFSRLLVEHVLYGAPWLTGARLRWIEAFTGDGNRTIAASPPPIVHLFGECDRLVNEDDHVEFHQDPAKILEIEILQVKHPDFQMESGGSARRQRAITRIGDIVEKSMLANPKAEIRQLVSLKTREVQNAGAPQGETPQASDYRVVGEDSVPERGPSSADETAFAAHEAPMRAEAKQETDGNKSIAESMLNPKHIVFLVHGIRDFAEWQDSLADKIRKIAAKEKLEAVQVVQVRYGYFSALQFLLSGERERATRSFLDLYAQTRARHPHAKFYAAAHSNGTYVVANALLENSYVELENVYMAGSVLACNFPWPEIGSPIGRLHGGRINGVVRSDRASQDWPVGVLCWVLAGFRRLPVIGKPYARIGAGGVQGFQKRVTRRCRTVGAKTDAVDVEFVKENKYLEGGHGAALQRKYHDGIARFVLTGEPWKEDDVVPKQDARYLWGVFGLAMLGVLVVALLFAASVMRGHPDPWWGVLVGSLLTLIVLRVGMAV